MSADMIAIRHPVRTIRHPGLVPARVAARGALRGALIWGAVFGLLILVLVSQYGKEYPTAADQAALVATMGANAGLQAIFGIARQLDTVGGYVAFHTIGLLGMIGAIWGLLAATRLLRGEEEAGRWELVLAGRTTRGRAAAGTLAGLSAVLLTLAVSAAMLVAAGIAVALFTWGGAAAADAEQGFVTLLAAGVNVASAGVFVLGTGALVYGLAPRYAVTATYVIVAWSFLAEMVGASVDVGQWLLNLSVLHYIARAPAVPVNWGSAAILTTAGITAAIAGALAFARRDLAGD